MSTTPQTRDERDGYSVNERAERVMGRRLTPEQEAVGVVAFDMPCELGYECPVHECAWDEGLDWSEYAGFLWCSRCNRDYPSALCIPRRGQMDPRRPWKNARIGDAITVYLDTVEQAVNRALASSRSTP